MFIKKINLNNFRCFENKQLSLDGQFVLISGNNGSGKTSLLEALHYSCYLRSFRTHINKELIALDQNHFFIQVDYDLSRTDECDSIQVGFSEAEGKIVKFNKKPIVSYKDLIDQYCLITMTADDLQLIDGSPTYRRDFINYFLLLDQPGFLDYFKRYKNILEQRNTLLQNSYQVTPYIKEQIFLWTKQLWELSQTIRSHRIALLQKLEIIANNFFTTFIAQHEKSIQFDYVAKNSYFYTAATFNDFWNHYEDKHLLEQELKYKRTIIGCHLDDFDVILDNKKARTFASRGQQKLLTFLIKIAQFKHLEASGRREVLLLDDFLTDFDEDRAKRCINMLVSFDRQILMTVPTQKTSLFSQSLPSSHFQIELK